ncbi:hypothetical protein DPMN_031403 [Dreissena polymorpha]|uniref:Uncharacterized protein n=1 Tax=Dreissena polymorpha TaxID=45954 RepID=A0A9D4RJ27_DREPO|nr:hypothetical protein DPMN_031403 [Dreissena polymorpha]
MFVEVSLIRGKQNNRRYIPISIPQVPVSRPRETTYRPWALTHTEQRRMRARNRTTEGRKL